VGVFVPVGVLVGVFVGVLVFDARDADGDAKTPEGAKYEHCVGDSRAYGEPDEGADAGAAPYVALLALPSLQQKGPMPLKRDFV